MLVEFSVSNFRSIKEKVTLSMVASKDHAQQENLIPTDYGFSLLPVAAIYGANASGKSNVIKSMMFCQDFITTRWSEKQIGDPIEWDPFLFDGTSQTHPTTFEVSFIHHSSIYSKDVFYRLHFGFNKTRVIDESLVCYPKGKLMLVYSRIWHEKTNNYEYSFGGGWKGEKKTIITHSPENLLFLTIAAQLNNKIAGEVMDWFNEKFRFISHSGIVLGEKSFTDNIVEDKPEQKKLVLLLMHLADLGITDISVKETKIEDFAGWRKLPKGAKEEIIKKMQSDEDNARLIDTYFTHETGKPNANRTPIRLSFFEESDGTQKFYSLTGPFIYCMTNGAVLVSDELDSRLHPLLIEKIVEMFMTKRHKRLHAQLIFAAHDTSLLEKGELLRRDQIWFTDKNKSGATQLYSLYDYDLKPRKNANFRKQYLAGIFGAVPNLAADWRINNGKEKPKTSIVKAEHPKKTSKKKAK
ncbi:MAG: hypothetical protein C4523_21140 [Myxococcales bacterium]|nr:MAG: hypothetical protein C4523_21140 [Myxococcales bacterium]